MPFVTHPSGQKTFYYDDDFTDSWQPTEAVLIYHGFGRNSDFWYGWVPALSRRYRVIRRDALGHGRSGVKSERTVKALMDEVIDTLDQLKIDKVHYLGQSTGGIFGMLLAARNPERFHSLAIVGTPLRYGPAGRKMLSFGYDSPSEALLKLGIRKWGEKSAQIIGTRGSQGFITWWHDTCAIASAEGVAAYSEVICQREFDAEPILKDIQAPMLSLAPGDSDLVDLNDQLLLHKVTGARLEIIPGHGHEVYLDHEKLCQEKYLDFLSSLKL